MIEWLFGVANVWVFGLIIFAVLYGLTYAGQRFRARQEAMHGEDLGNSESYIGLVASSSLGLMALLLGFTFSLAIDRYDTRRAMVLEEANAIGTAYLRTQFLPPEYAAAAGKAMTEYTQNRVDLANARYPKERDPLAKESTRLQDEIWTISAAGVRDMPSQPLASSYIGAVNNMIDIGSARVFARQANVPNEVMAILLFYLALVGFLVGYALTGRKGEMASRFLLVLFTIAIMLIIDLDRPTSGGIREPQNPMINQLASMKAKSEAPAGPPIAQGQTR